MTTTTPDMTAHTATTYQVWVASPEGEPRYLYRDALIYPVAFRWADAWNRDQPADVPGLGVRFVVVVATTTFEVVR